MEQEERKKEINETRKEIKRLYRILFPLLKDFDYNYVKSIREVESEIRNLCKGKNLIILFMLAGALEIDPDVLNIRMDPVILCKLLLEKVSNLGLSLSETEQSLLILPIKNFNLFKLICSELLYNGTVISEFYADYSSFLYEFKKDFLDKNFLDEKDRYYTVGPLGPLRDIDILKDTEDFKETSDLIRKYINFDVNTKDLIKILNTEGNVYRRRKYTWQEADFIIRVHDGFKSGKIPLNITKKELCKLNL